METLFIVACVANPLRWQSRIALARGAVADWLRSPMFISRWPNAPTVRADMT